MRRQRVPPRCNKLGGRIAWIIVPTNFRAASNSGWPLRAPVNHPSLLLADEPTGALDSATGADVLALFAEFHRQGLTVIVVTHARMVAQHAQRIISLRDGVIVSDSTGEVAPTERTVVVGQAAPRPQLHHPE